MNTSSDYCWQPIPITARAAAWAATACRGSYRVALLAFALAISGCDEAHDAKPTGQADPDEASESDAAPDKSQPGISKRDSNSPGLPPITPMRGTGKLAPPDNPQRFTFVVFGDNRPGEGEPQPETIKEIFAEIAAMDPPPAFALSLGDIIEGKDPQDSTDVIVGQFRDFLGLAAKAGVPIFNAPGNHEMDDDTDVPSERMHRLYQEHVAPSYGAFSYGNSRFICLNTENIPPKGTAPPEPPLEFSYISDTQLAELEADLEAHRDATHVFVAMHYPLQPKDARDRLNPVDAKKLEPLLAKYDNVAFVLAAHEHLFYNANAPDNTKDVPPFTRGAKAVHLVSGGAGAPLSDDGRWAFHHYLIFHVDGDTIRVELIPLQSTGAKS